MKASSPRHELIRRMLLAVLAAGLSCLSPQLARARTVTVTQSVPAKFATATVLKRLVIQPFRGLGAAEAMTALQSDLAAAQQGGQPYFQFPIVPAGGMARPELVADGVLAADVAVRAVDTPSQTLGLGCTAANPNGGCARFGLVTRQCVQRALTVTLTPTLTRAIDGQVVYSGTKTAQGTLAWCANDPAPTSNSPAVAAALKLIVADIHKDLLPSVQQVKLTIKDNDRALAKELKDPFRKAVRSANDDLASACGALRQIDTAAPNDPSVTFDLGLCAETAGEFSRALQYYQQAGSLLPAGDRDLVEATTRAGALSAAQEQQQRAQEALLAAQDQLKQKQAQEATAKAAAETAAHDRAAAQAAAASAAQASKIRAAKIAEDAKIRAATAKYGAAASAVLQHHIEKGMTQDQVLAAKGGPPNRQERIDAGDQQWYYSDQRIIFTNGKVSYIGS